MESSQLFPWWVWSSTQLLGIDAQFYGLYDLAALLESFIALKPQLSDWMVSATWILLCDGVIKNKKIKKLFFFFLKDCASIATFDAHLCYEMKLQAGSPSAGKQMNLCLKSFWHTFPIKRGGLNFVL